MKATLLVLSLTALWYGICTVSFARASRGVVDAYMHQFDAPRAR